MIVDVTASTLAVDLSVEVGSPVVVDGLVDDWSVAEDCMTVCWLSVDADSVVMTL